jgi:hypothetical protein
MSICIFDEDQIKLLEEKVIENMILSGCSLINEADLRCYYSYDCKREKCNFLFHDIRSCKKKCRYFFCTANCQNMHVDDIGNKYQLLTYIENKVDSRNNTHIRKTAMLVPYFY